MLGDLLGQSAVLTAPHVQALDFHLLDKLAVLLDQVDGRVLLLGLQQDATEDIVDVDLQKPVLLIDGLFELIADPERICDCIYIGIDHDRVCVSVNDL